MGGFAAVAVLEPERRLDRGLARPPGGSPSGESPLIVFVFGMGRSGTSALARALSLCGGVLPATLLGADDGNPKGHWEPLNALHLNEQFLTRHGSTWFDPTLRLQSEVVVSSAERDAYLDEIKAFLRGLPPAPIHIIKEPRITALSDFWFDAARQSGFCPAAAVPVRHPQEVSASLAARYRTSSELATALWLKYNLLAERHSRGLPRVFIEYSNFLQDWRTEVSRIEAALSIDLSVRDEPAIDDFLSPDLHRQRHGAGISEVFGEQWISRVYAALSAAARGEPLDTSALDAIFDSYRACEHAFRVSFDEFQTRFAPAAATAKPIMTRLIDRLRAAARRTARGSGSAALP
jgi:hypothetical protein